MNLKKAIKKLMVPALGLTLLFPTVAGAAETKPYRKHTGSGFKSDTRPASIRAFCSCSYIYD